MTGGLAFRVCFLRHVACSILFSAMLSILQEPGCAAIAPPGPSGNGRASVSVDAAIPLRRLHEAALQLLFYPRYARAWG